MRTHRRCYAPGTRTKLQRCSTLLVWGVICAFVAFALLPLAQGAAYLDPKLQRFQRGHQRHPVTSQASAALKKQRNAKLDAGLIPLPPAAVAFCIDETRRRSNELLEGTPPVTSAVERQLAELEDAAEETPLQRSNFARLLERILKQIPDSHRIRPQQLFNHEGDDSVSTTSRRNLECAALWGFDDAAAWHALGTSLAAFSPQEIQDAEQDAFHRPNQVLKRTPAQKQKFRFKEECFSRAHKLRPGDSTALMGVCAARMAQRGHALIDQCFESLLRLQCDSRQSCHSHAQMMQEMQQPSIAINSYTRALELSNQGAGDSDARDIITGLGQLLTAAGRFEELRSLWAPYTFQGNNYKKWRTWLEDDGEVQQWWRRDDEQFSKGTFVATSSHSDNFSIPTVEMRKLQRMREAIAHFFQSRPHLCEKPNMGSVQGVSQMGIQSMITLASTNKTPDVAWALLRQPAAVDATLRPDVAGVDPTPLGNAWGPGGIGWSASDWPLYVMNLVVAVCAQTSMPEPNRNRNEGSRRISPLPPSSLASERFSCEALLRATWLLDAPRVQELLNRRSVEATPAICRDAFGASPLHYAIIQADVLSFEAIMTGHMLSLEQGDAVKNTTCNTVLDVADMHGHTPRQLLCCDPSAGGSFSSQKAFSWTNRRMTDIVYATLGKVCVKNSDSTERYALCKDTPCRPIPALANHRGSTQYPRGWQTQQTDQSSSKGGNDSHLVHGSISTNTKEWNIALSEYRNSVPVVDARQISMAEVIDRYLSAGLPVVLRNTLGACEATVSETKNHSIYRMFDREDLLHSQLSTLSFESIVGLEREDIRIDAFASRFMGRKNPRRNISAFRHTANDTALQCSELEATASNYSESRAALQHDYDDLRYIAFHMEGAQQRSPRQQLEGALEPLTQLLDCVPVAIQEYFQLPPAKLPGAWSQYAVTLGGVGSGSQFHWHESALNLQLFGRKRWFLFHPAMSSNNQQTTLEWLDSTYQQLPPQLKPVEFIQEAGDLVLLPQFFGHATICLSDCMSIFHVNSVAYNKQLSGPFRDSAFSAEDHRLLLPSSTADVTGAQGFMFAPIAF